VIAPGATSTITVLLEWRADVFRSWEGHRDLVQQHGGEANGANNTSSITVLVIGERLGVDDQRRRNPVFEFAPAG
jgi:hypothetical protein